MRLLKTDGIDEAKFYITSVQGDQSETNLSSGKIVVDLLHKKEHFEEEGSLTLRGSAVVVLFSSRLYLLINSMQYFTLRDIFKAS